VATKMNGATTKKIFFNFMVYVYGIKVM